MAGNYSSGRRTDLSTLGPRRHHKRKAAKSVDLPKGAPDPPNFLLHEARAEWDRVVPDLVAQGVIARVDRGTLISYCTCHAWVLEAERLIAEQGLQIKEPIYNRRGDIVGEKMRRNPNCATHAEYLKVKKSYAVELGLSPGSRPRLRLENPASTKEDDEEGRFEEYMRRTRDHGLQLRSKLN